MATVYSIKHTDGVRTITIQPGTLNGPGGVLTDTDLQLYGQGTLQWGAGVDQNQLRLLENYAVEEKASSPGVPQDENDILAGSGAGVNYPIVGQSWYNLTDSQLYTYNGSDWVIGGSVFEGAAEPTNPVVGTLWFNTTTQQLNVYNGTIFESTAEQYLPLTGGNMVGNIYMCCNLIVAQDETDYDGAGSNGTFVGGDGAGGTAYVAADTITLTNGTVITVDVVDGNGDVTDFTVTVQGGPVTTGVAETQASSSGTGVAFTLTPGVANSAVFKVLGLTATPTDPTEAASMAYVDNEIASAVSTAGTDFVNVTGDTMTGVLQFDSNMFLYEGGGNHTVLPDIRFGVSGLITASDNLYLVSDDGATVSGDIVFAKGSQKIDGSEVGLLTIQNDGEIRAQTPSYETIAANNDQNLVNKKYVDDAVGVAAAGVAVAWAAYNGSSDTILDSFGIASVSKLGSGNYNFNLSAARPDTNYCVVVSAIDSTSTHGQNSPTAGQSNRLQLYTIRASVSSGSTFNVRTKFNDQIVRTVNDGDDDFEIPVTVKSLTNWSYITVVVYDN